MHQQVVSSSASGPLRLFKEQQTRVLVEHDKAILPEETLLIQKYHPSEGWP